MKWLRTCLDGFYSLCKLRANEKGFQALSPETLVCLAPRCPEHLHQVLENLQKIYRLKGVIEEHERKWSGIIGNCIKRG
jgi:hypothetical protein